MKRWHSKERREVERPDIDAFLQDVIKVCKKHGMCIAHQDHHGSFLVEPIKKINLKWLLNAAVSE